ncbi:hypothetical protein L7F22_002076 [Adiantum nelumboides]|nr:hypothetical protein [Adiantum nelumboides]
MLVTALCKNSQDKDDKSDRKGKKPKPSVGLVPDLVHDQQNVDAKELCRAWEKVRDQEVLVFFDPKACANFISPELASKLGIRAKETGITGEVGLACPGHSEAVSPILRKLRLHIQSYVDAEEFHIMPCRTVMCCWVKFDKQKAPGLLQPLPIPDKPWESIAMDFIFYLPRTPTGNDGIWTIICRFSKQAHFVPVRKKIKSDHMVKLFMHNIFKYHGMPQSIVSDRDPRMTSLFWKALFENMGTTLKFSSSFHPQTDGQSEEANSTVLDLLKCYVSEHKATWEHYLPLVEYAYNNTVHTSTGKAPFEIVEGGKKVPPILQTKDKIFEADKYVQNMDEAYRKIKLALEKTQSKQKKAADRHRRELVFSLGDWVLLRFEKARLRKMKGKERLFPKLGMRYYGPFQVCDKISDVAYRLKLPEGWKIHNAFHVSLLRPFVGDVSEDMVPEEQPEVEELDEILVPEQILAHKDRKVRGKVARRYLVKFKNYSPMDAKWMEEAELVDSPQLLQLYLEAFQLQPTVT